MSSYNLGMPGNTHVDKLIAVGNIPVETANYYATMALAFETRTANLIALYDRLSDGSACLLDELVDETAVADMIKGRLGL